MSGISNRAGCMVCCNASIGFCLVGRISKHQIWSKSRETGVKKLMLRWIFHVTETGSVAIIHQFIKSLMRCAAWTNTKTFPGGLEWNLTVNHRENEITKNTLLAACVLFFIQYWRQPSPYKRENRTIKECGYKYFLSDSNNILFSYDKGGEERINDASSSVDTEPRKRF